VVSEMVRADTLAGPARFVVTCFVPVNFLTGMSEVCCEPNRISSSRAQTPHS